MTIIVWPDGATEAIHDALVGESITEGARLATTQEQVVYEAWLEWCE